MTPPQPPKNLAASVSARLWKLARERREEPPFVQTRYTIERRLYRLSVSAHASSFVLKGAALFAVWSGHPHRPTKDIELFGWGATRNGASRPAESPRSALLAAPLPVRLDPGEPLGRRVGQVEVEQRHTRQLRPTLAHGDNPVSAREVKLHDLHRDSQHLGREGELEVIR
jgi:hypothetical protein